jgi:hypothetical protein
MHLESEIPNPVDAGALEKGIRNILGSYNKSNIEMEKFIPGLERAMKVAANLDCNPDHRWPNTVGTRVYRVVERLKILGVSAS